MAFVSRAEKISIFEEPSLIAHTKEQTQLSEIHDDDCKIQKEERIHCKRDLTYRNFMEKKPLRVFHRRQQTAHIGNSALKVTTKPNLEVVLSKRKKQNKTFKDLKNYQKCLSKYFSKDNSSASLNSLSQFSMKNNNKIHKNIDKRSMKSTFIKKTLQEDLEQTQKHKKQGLEPGPGDYNIKIPIFNSQGALINPLHQIPKNIAKIINEDDSTERSKKQNLFAVKYHKMSSSFFKQPSNLVQYSNKLLLNKIFRKKGTGFSDQNQDEEYVANKERSPSPDSYNVLPKMSKNQSKSSSSFISTSARFPLCKDSSQISYLELNKIQQDMNQSSAFISKKQRFQDPLILNHKTQYSSIYNLNEKETKNRKMAKFPFCSGVLRKDEIKEDYRPFYSSEKPFHNPGDYHWSEYRENRILEYPENYNPGPGEYESPLSTVNKNNRCFPFPKAARFMLKKAQEDPSQRKKSVLILQNVGIKKDDIFKPSKKIHKRKHQKLAPQKENIQKEYYNQQTAWSKKSYNKLFTNHLLSSNNPCQKQF